MQNIKIPQRIGNSITRFAYLNVIYDSIKKLGDKYDTVSLDGYSSDKDKVHFTYAGKKCKLEAVAVRDYTLKDGQFIIYVGAKNKGVYGIWELRVNVQDFRFKTLDRIAYEVYDYCKREDDPEYEEYRDEMISGSMDNYREFMS